ncbi:lipocalin family protein [Ohtaekwangia sp.]|uniref:lipocalin family protein n=1 Tax=Ohtaekwangia sp. TaxID=2066019 RepID=UPI002F936607
MTNKILIVALALATLGSASVSCSENIPDCPSRMCVMAGGWKLTEVYIDGEKDVTSDLSQYRLILTSPSPATDTTSSFSRTQVSGKTDSGNWSIRNNNTVLQLIPSDAAKEQWIIESLTPRKLVLIIHRDTNIKQGPSTIEFILEPY